MADFILDYISLISYLCFKLYNKLRPTFAYSFLNIATAFFFQEECLELVMRCFFLETAVIVQECRIKNCSKTLDVWNIWKNGNESLDKNKVSNTNSLEKRQIKNVSSVAEIPLLLHKQWDGRDEN